MRLLDSEKQLIVAILRSHCAAARIYLHGSRIHDALKGGDIDLFWLVPTAMIENLQASKYKVIADLSQALRDQRIDLSLIAEEQAADERFFTDSKKIELV